METVDASTIEEPSTNSQDLTMNKKDSMIVHLLSNDEKRFGVSFKVIQRAYTIRDLINDLGVEPDDDNAIETIPLPNVSASVLEKVLQWLEYHRDDALWEDLDNEEQLFVVKPWDKQFFGSDIDSIVDVIMAANYLNIKHLLNMGIQTVADAMKGKSVEQLRTLLRIENDYSPQEEAALSQENSWALQD